MRDQNETPAKWKTAVIAAIALLVVAGLFVVMFNLPVVTGEVPQ